MGVEHLVGMFYRAPVLLGARCDFPGGDAKTLYQSIQKILSYPNETKLYMCHDYGRVHLLQIY
mgnify:CR=1 FL=1